MIKERPFTVTLVCLYLLLVGSAFLVMSFGSLQEDKVQTAMAAIAVPYHVQVAVLYVNLALMVICAIFMFQEANWARWVYLAWGLVHVGYAYYTQRDFYANQPNFCPNWLEMVTYPLFALLLLLPNANRWFSSKIEFVD